MHRRLFGLSLLAGLIEALPPPPPVWERCRPLVDAGWAPVPDPRCLREDDFLRVDGKVVGVVAGPAYRLGGEWAVSLRGPFEIDADGGVVFAGTADA